MGLDKIVRIRQYTDFTSGGKIVKMFEVTFTTVKTDGEFTFDIPKDEYEPKKALKEARTQADNIDEAIK